MPNSIGEPFLPKSKDYSKYLRDAVGATAGLLLLLSLLSLVGQERPLAFSTLAVAIPSILIASMGLFFPLKPPQLLPQLRLCMFSLLFILLLSSHIPGDSLQISLYLFPSALWALLTPYQILYTSELLWGTIALDTLIITAFLPFLPPASPVLLAFPLYIISLKKGSEGALVGMMVLVAGILYFWLLPNKVVGSSLLTGAILLIFGSLLAGTLAREYRLMFQSIRKLHTLFTLCRTVSRETDIARAMETFVNCIVSLVKVPHYLIELHPEGKAPIILSSQDFHSQGGYEVEEEFKGQLIQGKAMFKREERFSREEKEIIRIFFQETMPFWEQIFILKRMGEITFTDPLTSLANRHFLLYRLSEDMERSIRYNIPLSLLFLDIDGFKRYNDTYGHLIGDEALRQIGGRLKSLVRKSDLVARYGGDEFVILFPHTLIDKALSVSERVRQGIEELRLPKEARLTISAGLTMYRMGESAEELLRRADRLLYQAKAKGGNRVEVG